MVNTIPDVQDDLLSNIFDRKNACIFFFFCSTQKIMLSIVFFFSLLTKYVLKPYNTFFSNGNPVSTSNNIQLICLELLM